MRWPPELLLPDEITVELLAGMLEVRVMLCPSARGGAVIAWEMGCVSVASWGPEVSVGDTVKPPESPFTDSSWRRRGPIKLL